MRQILTMLVTAWLAGCANGPESLVATKGRELHLYISNQSFSQPTADLLVTVDGEVLFHGEARVDDQRTWMLREADLEPGAHTLEAWEQSSSTRATQAFTVEEGQERSITVA